MKKRLTVSKNELKHSSRGIFQYKNRKPVRMLKGGHGEKNLTYLKRHNLSYEVQVTAQNGVRQGKIDCHARPWERAEKGKHMWFPRAWGDRTISSAGEHVANLKKNQNVPDHKPMRGRYRGVSVVAYKGRGRICGVCPEYLDKKEKSNGK